MDRQTLRDWVHRYNGEGIDGLKSRSAPGRAPVLTEEQLAELKALVLRGPDPMKRRFGIALAVCRSARGGGAPLLGRSAQARSANGRISSDLAACCNLAPFTRRKIPPRRRLLKKLRRAGQPYPARVHGLFDGRNLVQGRGQGRPEGRPRLHLGGVGSRPPMVLTSATTPLICSARSALIAAAARPSSCRR